MVKESVEDLFLAYFGEEEEDIFVENFEDQVFVALFGADGKDEDVFLDVYGEYPDEFFDFCEQYTNKTGNTVELPNKVR